MPRKGPSQTARVAAVAGLIAAFIVVIIVIASSGGGGSGGSDSVSTPGASSSGPDTKDPKVQKALQKGEWEVKEGDTLAAIADATGIDQEKLITLNPDLDPQALQPGQRVKLR